MQHKNILVDERRVHYVESGSPDGFPLVLLHGWAASWKTYEEFLKYLDPRFHAVAPDFPGFGHSEELKTVHSIKNYVRFLHHFIRTFNIREFNLMGSSFGAIVATVYASVFSHRVKNLILNSTPYYHKMFVDPRALYLGSLASRSEAATRILSAFCKSPLMLKIYPRNRPLLKKYIKDARLKEYFYDSREFSERAVMESLSEIIKIDIRGHLSKLKTPTLVLGGDHDSVTNQAAMGGLKTLLPKAEFVIFKNSDHGGLCEHPKEFAQAVNRFV